VSSEETAPPPGPVAGRRWLERGREAWRSEIGRIVIVVVATRAAMFALGALVVTLGGGIAVPEGTPYLDRLATPYERGDVAWYMGIVEDGYAEHEFIPTFVNWAFFPLWPALVKAVSALGPSPMLAGLLLANACFVAAMVLLYRLMRLDQTPTVARRTVWIALAFPSAYFTMRPGPESLFLLLVVAAFLAARREDRLGWTLAAGLGAGAALTRVQGVLIVLPLLWMYVSQYRRSRADRFSWLALGAIPLALLAFAYYLYTLTGEPLTMLRVQEAWDARLAIPFSEAFAYLRDPVLTDYYEWNLAVVSVPVSIAAVAILVLTARDRGIRPEYTLYAALLLLVVVARTNTSAAFRYLLPAFPFFLTGARLTRGSDRAFGVLVAVLWAVQLFYFVAFLGGTLWAIT
jgi:hypothetical protein